MLKVVDRIVLAGQKNSVPVGGPHSPLAMLARARDEAHRFANFARERSQKNRVLRSELDDIPGLGPNLRKTMLSKLGSVHGVKTATDEQLLLVPGFTSRHLRSLRVTFVGPE